MRGSDYTMLLSRPKKSQQEAWRNRRGRKKGRKREKSVVISQGLGQVTSAWSLGQPTASSLLQLPSSRSYQIHMGWSPLSPTPPVHHPNSLLNLWLRHPVSETISGPPGPASSPGLGPRWDPSFTSQGNRTCARHLISELRRGLKDYPGPLKTGELMKVQNPWEVPGIRSGLQGRCLINQNTLCVT